MGELKPCPLCGNRCQGCKFSFSSTRHAEPVDLLTEDQKKADTLIRLLIKGEDVNPCEWCRQPDKGGEKCKGCYLYEDTDEFPSKFTAFAAPENKPLTLDQLESVKSDLVEEIVSSFLQGYQYGKNNEEYFEDRLHSDAWNDINEIFSAYARKPEGSA